jgi:hypothetical protein
MNQYDKFQGAKGTGSSKKGDFKMKRKYIVYAVMFVAVMTCATITSVRQLRAAPKAYSLCGPNCTSDDQCIFYCPFCISGTCHAIHE